ncbi:hypothetical protein HD554DRAFT_2037729 [Boletus coccyginus]|nr:hypothetical protein HD554DRAFT_2037729 [Boletus coccyginus]
MDTLATNRSNSNPTITDPLAINASSTNKALDIDHFFQKKTEQTVCKLCESIVTKLVARGDSYNIQYHFSQKTSNMPLHHHIEIRHALLYLKQAEKQGWAIKLKSVKATFISGYIHIQNSQQPAFDANLPSFTINGLKDYIAINKIESPEFRQLLLYCSPWGITDANILHHTKMWKLILDAFETIFSALQAELSRAMGEILFTADI